MQINVQALAVLSALIPAAAFFYWLHLVRLEVAREGLWKTSGKKRL
jgi:hypothetical protein